MTFGAKWAGSGRMAKFLVEMKNREYNSLGSNPFPPLEDWEFGELHGRKDDSRCRVQCDCPLQVVQSFPVLAILQVLNQHQGGRLVQVIEEGLEHEAEMPRANVVQAGPICDGEHLVNGFGLQGKCVGRANVRKEASLQALAGAFVLIGQQAPLNAVAGQALVQEGVNLEIISNWQSKGWALIGMSPPTFL